MEDIASGIDFRYAVAVKIGQKWSLIRIVQGTGRGDPQAHRCSRILGIVGKYTDPVVVTGYDQLRDTIVVNVPYGRAGHRIGVEPARNSERHRVGGIGAVAPEKQDAVWVVESAGTGGAHHDLGNTVLLGVHIRHHGRSGDEGSVLGGLPGQACFEIEWEFLYRTICACETLAIGIVAIHVSVAVVIQSIIANLQGVRGSGL